MNRTLTFLPPLIGGAALLALLAWFLPSWNFVLAIGLAKGLPVLGLVLLMRGGLVSFGQGLYYALGGYTVGLASQFFGLKDAAALLVIAAIGAAVVAFVVGLLLSRYRDIFFAMLTLALSMLLYGILVKSTELGGTDGFNIHGITLFGLPLTGADRMNGFGLLIAIVVLAAINLGLFGATAFGRLLAGVRDNEIRVEYLGASANRAVLIAYVLAAVMAALGGAMSGIIVGHIDPEMAFWATSGEFVVIAILAGTGGVIAPFVAAVVLEVVRSFAYQYAPNTWQLVLGLIILALILFLPQGLSGLVRRGPRAAPAGEKP